MPYAQIEPTDGVLIEGGVTTIRWGTGPWGTYALVILRANQRRLVTNDKLPQGAGQTSTRVQTVDGVVWDLTVRDDTRINTADLAAGASVNIFDFGGLLDTATPGGFVSPSGPQSAYAATIVEDGYEIAPKTAGERTITVERLRLIEGT